MRASTRMRNQSEPLPSWRVSTPPTASKAWRHPLTEMANADLKQAVTKLAPARTKLQLVKAAARHLRSVQRQPERIKSYFEHEPVRYAA